MIQKDGRKRVVITNVAPVVDGGLFPARTSIHEQLNISADIFGDGHDEIGASIFIRHQKERAWKEHAMIFSNNDHWEYNFKPAKTGIYQFQMAGWIAHFDTWRKGLQKKYEAKQKIDVDLLIGALLLKDALQRANAKDKIQLQKWTEQLEQPDEVGNIFLWLNGEKIDAVMSRSRDKTLYTIYPDIFEIEVERKKAGYSSWYELFPRSASSKPVTHGTFKDVEKLLPRIAKMGFDVLYMPPIHPIGEVKRKGKNNSLEAKTDEPGSPWAIGNKLGGHKSVHPQLGTSEDFKHLVATAKSYDIDIALDIAFQCAPDHPYVNEHPEWFSWRPDGTVQYAENPPKKYEDILPFNFETKSWKALWEELKSIIDFWIEQGVEIFRIDNPHTKSLSFWEWLIKEERRKNPQIIFLAEAFTRPRIMEQLAKAGFNQSYTYFTWRNTKYELQQYLTELTKTDIRYYFRPNFWVNTPDILSEHLATGGENAHIMRLILAATMSANYGMYGPLYEFGINIPYPGKEEYIDNEKYEIKHWNWEQYTRIGEIIARINKIRKENAALQTTYNIEFAETDNEQLICYYKTDEATNNRLIVIVNLDVRNTQSGYVRIPLNKLNIGEGSSFVVFDLLGGDKYHWQDEWNFVQLNPNMMPAHILRIE